MLELFPIKIKIYNEMKIKHEIFIELLILQGLNIKRNFNYQLKFKN